MVCPDDVALAAFAKQSIPPDQLATLKSHIDDCASCKAGVLLAKGSGPGLDTTLAVGTPGTYVEGPDLTGSVIGDRYTIEKILGKGGMGIVYLARDKSLGRDVALKVHHAGSSESRLAREAQAMAKLAHPHVVTVFEIANVGDRMYVAMEYVRGTTLRTWLKRPRSTREIVDTLLGVGSGLAAAHAAGLVHRDFKPENVLVGDDGRARVSDFGLAGAGEELHGAKPSEGALGTPMTQTGEVLGTPAYMAPEQLTGDRVDTRSDQFAYCVTAWEALYGKRPFDGVSPFSMLKAIEKRELADGRGKLPRVRTVLEKGLSSEANDRYADMNALLVALGKATATRTWLYAALGAAGVVVAAVCMTASLARAQTQGPMCIDGGERIAPTWNADRRAEITRVITANGLPSTAPILVSHLDAFSTEWATQYSAACTATKVRAEQSADLLDRRMTCLERNRVAFGTLVDQLLQADRSVAEKSVSAALQLPSNDACADGSALLALAPPPKDLDSRLKLGVATAQLASAETLRGTGKYDAALALANQVAVSARAIGYKPFIADALGTVARLEDEKTKYADEEKHIYEALHAAEAGGDLRQAADLWCLLVNDVGLHLERAEEADRLLGLADAAIERAGNSADLRGHYWKVRGNLYVKEGQYAQARDAFIEEAKFHAMAYGPNDPSVAHARVAEGTQWENLDNFPEAKKRYEESRDILVKALGAEHPDVIYAYENVAVITGRMGEFAKGVEELQKVLDLSIRVLGENTERSAEIIDEMSALSLEQEKWDDALKYASRAADIFTKVVGPEHSLTMDALAHLVAAKKHTGHLEEAFEIQTRITAITERQRGPEHPRLAYKLQNLGSIEMDRNHPREAEKLFRRAYAIFLKAYGPDHSLTKGAKDAIDQAVSAK
ncbi:MAG TPA: serine/threonine-protein kinase [Kofleriaceae bacterium]|jgi:serine/threonine protein kinase